jgi:hypothetical protein
VPIILKSGVAVMIAETEADVRADDETVRLEAEVRKAELLARRAEARLRQLKAERERTELLAMKKPKPQA